MIKQPKLNLSALTLLLLITLSVDVFAADICVSNSTEFQAALNTAENNGQDDHIKLKSGNYPAPANDPFEYLPPNTEFGNLKISGGWNDFGIGFCNFRAINTSAFDTELDGQSQHDILRIYPNNNTDVIISELTFINGNNTDGNASGLIILTSGSLNNAVVVENNVFLGNQAFNFSALLVHGGKVITLRNNLIIANHAENYGAVSLQNIDNQGIYFTNNTVLSNTTGGVSTTDSAAVNIFTTGGSKAFIANNILWNNEIGDLYFNAASYFYHNDIGSYINAVVPIDFAGNFSTNPGFESTGPGGLSFTPAYHSNLYNQGIQPPQFIPINPPFELAWTVGVNDTFGRDRVVNGRVDIGSFEAPREPPIFENGFEG